jgi:hypothetical protein
MYTPDPENLRIVRVCTDVIYFSNLLPGNQLVVPAGAYTDGASIPRPFRWLVGQPFWPPFWKGTLLHDMMYRKQIASQKTADLLLRELLRQNGVGRLRRGLMWAALRLAGWYYWRAHRGS